MVFPAARQGAQSEEVGGPLMVEDLVSCLTRQVKEEVVEKYLLERRLIELQSEHLDSVAGCARKQAQGAGLRLARLASLMIEPEMQQRLYEMLGVQPPCFWSSFFGVPFRGRVRFIWARALTKSAKYRKLVLESYSRFHSWMSQYEDKYAQVVAECSAVNRNIEAFHKNFDLLCIVNFLKGLDAAGMERKKILGENFTAREMAALDESLYIAPVSLEKLNIPLPLQTPAPDSIRRKLFILADEVFARYPEKVRKILL